MDIAIFVAAYILLPSLVSFVACSQIGWRVAFMLGCCMVPAFLILLDFAAPFSVGGHSMWGVALVLGSLVGAVSSGVGVVFGRRVFRDRNA